MATAMPKFEVYGRVTTKGGSYTRIVLSAISSSAAGEIVKRSMTITEIEQQIEVEWNDLMKDDAEPSQVNHDAIKRSLMGSFSSLSDSQVTNLFAAGFCYFRSTIIVTDEFLQLPKRGHISPAGFRAVEALLNQTPMPEKSKASLKEFLTGLLMGMPEQDAFTFFYIGHNIAQKNVAEASKAGKQVDFVKMEQ